MDNVINTLQVVRGDTHFCPLMKKNISEVFCYEINSVAFGLRKPSLINNAANREEAEPMCENCDNRVM